MKKHHPNSRRFRCSCGRYREWPNRPGNTGAKARAGLVNGKSFTRPWVACGCGRVHVRGERGVKEYEAAMANRGRERANEAQA